MTNVKRLPTVSPLLFEGRPRVITRCGNSPVVSVPRSFAEALETLGYRQVGALAWSSATT